MMGQDLAGFDSVMKDKYRGGKMADSLVKSEMKKAVKPKKWIQGAVAKMKEKGTVGSLTRMAHSAGKSTMSYAREHMHSPGKVGAKARFAINVNK